MSMSERFISYDDRMNFEICVDDWISKATTISQLEEIRSTFLEYLMYELDNKEDELESGE